MKRLKFALIIVSLFAACKKETAIADLSPDLLGIWYAEDQLQLTIENRILNCKCATFKERKEADGRYLDVVLSSQITNYKILIINHNTLDLKDLKTNKEFHLLRIK